MWATLACTVSIEVGALLLLLYATLARVLLVYVLPTMGARLTFICQSNLPGNLSVGISLLVMCVAWVVALGGLLHSPRWGMMLAAAGPVCLVFVLHLLADYYLQATLLLHSQCKDLIAKAEGDGGSGGSGRNGGGRDSPPAWLQEGVTLRLLAHDRPPILERSMGSKERQGGGSSTGGGGSGGTWGSGRLRNLTPGGLSKRWAGLGYGKPRVV
jgi:hypothetical protein